MPTSIRITLTPKLDRVLKHLQHQRFSLLEPAEIIRAVLSEYDALRQRQQSTPCPPWMTKEEQKAFQRWEAALPVLELSEQQWEDIDTARTEKGKALPITALWKKSSSRKAA